MAKREDKGARPTGRVFKSGDVHRRRVGDAARSKPAKLPTKREARESARESMRINAEARAGKLRAADPDAAVSAETAEEPVVSPEAAEETAVSSGPADAGFTREAAKRPRFTAVRGAKGDDRSEQPARGRPRFTEAEPATSGLPASGQQSEPEADRADESAADSVDDQAQQSRASAAPRRRAVAGAAGKLPALKPSTIAVATILVLAVVAVAFFAFNRWGRYDDHADLQGTWYVLGTEVPITIDAETIYFNDQVSYRYEIDAREKTMSYTFGPMSGQGRYWFSDDRNHLVITDGDGYTAANTTAEDLMHAFLDFSTATGGGVVELPQGEGIIAFSRTPEKIITNEAAEGLMVDPSGGSAAAQAQEAAATGAASQEGEPAPEAETAEEQPIAEDGSSDETRVGDAASEGTYDKPTSEEEAA